MSRISVDVSSARIPVLQVGYQGENEVTDVLFDISSWITEFGEGVAQLRVKRPGNSEEESYVLSLTITDGIAVWTVSETDTFNKGNGKVQLSYLVGNIVKKAVIYPYKVGKSIVGADNPVDPFDSWIERSKAWAIGETLDGNAVPETDETYQNNAKYYAEQADILGSAQVVLATEQVTLATEKATLATAKANAAAESEANAAASEAAVNGVSTQLTTRMSAIETEQSVQSARMDTFTSLPEGSTSGNAELADIRVGADGTTYDTAGNAVRGQIGELKSDLADIDKLLEHEVIKPYSQNGSATISTAWDYVHVLDNIELPTAKMYRFTFTIPSATTNVIYCRARKGTTTFLQLQIEAGNTSVSLDKYCEPLDIDYLDATGDTNAVGLTVSATIEEIGGEIIEKSIVDKVEMNPLYGKTVLFNGDSICASATDTEYNLAWAGRIMNRNSMNGKNYAVMGGTISSNNYRNDSSAYHWISASVDTMYSENPNADYIIFEGGTNDADLLGSIINGNTSERLGTFSLGDFSGNYDMNTFCGAFENLCYKATNYWTGKKIGYVVAYKMAGQSGLSSGYTKEKSNRRAYFDIAMQICEKWGIPVLNLWDNCYMNPSNVACYDPSLSEAENKSTKMIYDGQHPATKGYEYIYPIIESWMKTL